MLREMNVYNFKIDYQRLSRSIFKQKMKLLTYGF